MKCEQSGCDGKARVVVVGGSVDDGLGAGVGKGHGVVGGAALEDGLGAGIGMGHAVVGGTALVKLAACSRASFV